MNTQDILLLAGGLFGFLTLLYSGLNAYRSRIEEERFIERKHITSEIRARADDLRRVELVRAELVRDYALRRSKLEYDYYYQVNDLTKEYNLQVGEIMLRTRIMSGNTTNPPPESVPHLDERYCLYCGTRLLEGDRSCDKCGAPIQRREDDVPVN